MIIEDSLHESVKPSKILGIKKIKRRSQAVPGYPTTQEEFQKIPCLFLICPCKLFWFP